MDETPCTALLFPGQGSQHEQMRGMIERYASDLLAEATRRLGADPLARLEDGTRFVQPAIFLAGIACARAREDLDADLFSGHSMGEITALVAAGSLEAEAGLDLIVERAIITDRVAVEAGGGMVALLGVDNDRVGHLAADWGLQVANDNCPGQVVVSGSVEGLVAAERSAEDGRMRAVRLPVSGPFHSSLMEEAVPEFRVALEGHDFKPSYSRVVSSTTARRFTDPVAELAGALTSPVRWREASLHLRELGAECFLEAAPGKTLTGLLKRTVRGADLRALENETPA